MATLFSSCALIFLVLVMNLPYFGVALAAVELHDDRLLHFIAENDAGLFARLGVGVVFVVCVFSLINRFLYLKPVSRSPLSR